MHRPNLVGAALVVLAACNGGDKTGPSETGHTGTTTSTPTPTPTDSTPTTDAHTGTVTDSTSTTDTSTGLPPGLHGSAPTVAKSVPSFSQVTNRLGAPMSSADLVGHPTVVWFYPAAATGG
jgi:hypothetical protein